MSTGQAGDGADKPTHVNRITLAASTITGCCCSTSLAAGTSAVSAAAAKALVYDGLGQDREHSRAIEHQVFRWMGNQADAAGGVTAFLEKRAPQWPLSKVKA